MQLPSVIQGGMGVAISDWRLARAASTHGALGVVSGTALDQVLARRLQTGDAGGHMRRALAAFPNAAVSHRILERYFVANGKAADQSFQKKPQNDARHQPHLDELTVAANFVEVFLAKEGHGGAVGINYLHKIQTPFLAALYGALLAGVDVVLVGAGIPLDVPASLDGLCANEAVELRLNVRDAKSGMTHKVRFDPAALFPAGCPPVHRPLFFPIVSSATLATLLVKKCKGKIDGLIFEEPSAGGHNAPPRGGASLDAAGEPIYGERDTVDLAAVRALGLPFWMAGSYGSPEKLEAARAAGAAGIQVGTLFAFSAESGLRDDLKRAVLDARGNLEVFTDPVASPTGFPFKVLELPGTLSDPGVYADRGRLCDLGFLREAYEKPDGQLGWRCSAEHPEVYVQKGGKLEDTVGRKCLCNALLANVGMPQVRGTGAVELPLVTCGDDLLTVARVLDRAAAPTKGEYSAASAIDYLLSAGTAGCP